jgi:hypothetical protein
MKVPCYKVSAFPYRGRHGDSINRAGVYYVTRVPKNGDCFSVAKECSFLLMELDNSFLLNSLLENEVRFASVVA